MANAIVFIIYILISTALFASAVSCYAHWMQCNTHGKDKREVKYYITFTTLLYIFMMCFVSYGFIICSK